MKRFTPALHFLACALFTAACTAERGAQATDSDPGSVENVEWKLVALDGAPVTGASGGAPTITLSSKDKRVTGFAGCNQLTGGYELKSEQLHFTAIATTRMFCPDPNPETALLRALDATSRWKVEDRTLDLLDASGKSVARWTVTVIESGEKS
ncbi:MAG: META domain-containing protein [Burkholderiales bacterium]